MEVTCMDIPERDWKTLRALQADLLDRFCDTRSG